MNWTSNYQVTRTSETACLGSVNGRRTRPSSAFTRRRSQALPRRVGVAVRRVDALVCDLDGSLRHAVDQQLDLRRRRRDIVVVIVPDQNGDRALAAGREGGDVGT